MTATNEVVSMPVVAPSKKAPRPLLELLRMGTPERWEDREAYKKEVYKARHVFRVEHQLGLRRDEVSQPLDVVCDIFKVCAAKLLPIFDELENRNFIVENVGEPGMSREQLLEKWLPRFTKYLKDSEVLQYLSPSDIFRLYYETRCGALSNLMYEYPPLAYFHKLVHSGRHWCMPGYKENGETPWPLIVKYHQMFMAFDFGAGFDITIDHSYTSSNEFGGATYTGSTYDPQGDEFHRWFPDPVTGVLKEATVLDASMAFIISNKGKQVMTIGVSPTASGLLVGQVQLRNEKGNRWLYKLPKPYFQYVLERLHRACAPLGINMYLVTGDSLSRAIEACYKKSKRKWKREVGEHIVRLYNQPLDGFTRIGEVTRLCERDFHLLAPTATKQHEAA